MVWPEQRVIPIIPPLPDSLSETLWTLTGLTKEIRILRRDMNTPATEAEHQVDVDRRDKQMKKTGH